MIFILFGEGKGVERVYQLSKMSAGESGPIISPSLCIWLTPTNGINFNCMTLFPSSAAFLHSRTGSHIWAIMCFTGAPP